MRVSHLKYRARIRYLSNFCFSVWTTKSCILSKCVYLSSVSGLQWDLLLSSKWNLWMAWAFCFARYVFVPSHFLLLIQGILPNGASLLPYLLPPYPHFSWQSVMSIFWQILLQTLHSMRKECKGQIAKHIFANILSFFSSCQTILKQTYCAPIFWKTFTRQHFHEKV